MENALFPAGDRPKSVPDPRLELLVRRLLHGGGDEGTPFQNFLLCNSAITLATTAVDKPLSLDRAAKMASE